MHNLLLAFLLVVLSVVPATDFSRSLEEKIRNEIDTPRATETSTENQNITITEPLDELTQRSANARAAYFYDPVSGAVLLSKNAETRLPIASTTKMMTALVVVESANLNDMVKVSKIHSQTGDSIMGLAVGDELSVESLMQGLLINSGSDAATVLADYVSGTQEDFVALMNERAKLLGLDNTQFTNPVGWDEAGNYSTAHDLAILTKVVLSNDAISKIMAQKSATVRAKSGKAYYLVNTNALLDNTHYLGAKTGTTYKAGECLAVYYTDDNKDIIGVLLNAPSRFPEARSIINWISDNYSFR